MDSKAFFQACQEGDAEKLLELFQSDEQLDVNGKDGYGMTGLAYAARNGHVEVVRQLLSRGAERTEVLEQGYGKNNADIARLLEEGPTGSAPSEAQVADEAGAQQGMPMHHQMNEGSFINGAMYPPQGYPMMPGYGGPLPGQQYFYDGHPGSAGRMQNHSRKESGANLPPTEVARSIPCRYFPNCRYGDKCMFAHPIMAMPTAGPPGSAPISPSMSPPAMQPIFYQHMPAGYPYPGPYGAGPQFYPSMGPMQSPYGMAAPYNQGMMQPPPPPPPQHSGVGQTASNDNQEATEGQADVAAITSSSSQAVVEMETKPAISSLKAAAEKATDERDATSTPPQQDGAAPSASDNQNEGSRGVNGAEDTSAEAAQGKPVHRRQSFNSFLHHHAVPFQPTALPPTADMAMMSTMQAFVPRMGPKRRGPGANGTGKRNNGERSACMFFARGGCKFGDECRFPHLLTDGTDARPIQAQQRQVYASAYGVVNSALRMPGNGVGDVPASAPTGPQAEKKAASEKQQQQQQSQQENQKSALPLQTKSTSQQSSSAASGATPVVPSIPSKTSSGTGPASSRGAHNKKQQHNNNQQSQHQQPSQPAQRVPTVNDFPALAVSSPNLGGQASTSPSSPSEPAVMVPASSSTPANGDIPSPATNPPSTASNGKRANFSAILSAPAPPKVKAPVETLPAKAASAEDGSQESSNGRATETPAKVNGTSKDSKPRTKESKTVKVDSYKSAVVSPASSNKASLQQADDDFQLVNRSRNSNPSSNQSKAVAA